MGQLTVVKSEPMQPRQAGPLAVVKSEPLRSGPTRADVAAPFGASSTDVADSLGTFLKSAWDQVNPVTAVKGLGAMASDPIGTGKALLDAQGRLAHEADDAFRRGDYITGLRKGLHWLLPVIGPAIDVQADKMAEGKYAEGLGGTTGLGVGMFAPTKIPQIRAHVPSAMRVNPKEAGAIAFAERRGIPVDAGTATGRNVVHTIQKRVENSMGGAATADRFRDAQQAGMTRVAGELADQVHPSPLAPEQAGQAVRDAVTKRAADYAAAADQAYTRLRALEAQQAQRIAAVPGGAIEAPPTSRMAATNIPLAVDVAPTKAAMRPIYDSLKREADLVPLMGDKSRALIALDRLMQAPDMAPLSIADAALGELKTLARVDQSFRRSAGQGVAAEAVKNLEQSVRSAAIRGGRDVWGALMEGRAATVNKFKTIDVLDGLRTEPVQAFRQATYAKDAGIAQLREVAKIAPAEMQKLGRAYLDDLVAKATAEGGFGHGDALWANWQNLGPQTKQLLFKDRGLIAELDHFFLLAKRAAKNPNPSGTAYSMTVLNVASQPLMYGLSKLLYTPKGVRLLTRGFTIKAGDRAASAAWQSELLNLAEQSRAAGATAVADREQPTGRR